MSSSCPGVAASPLTRPARLVWTLRKMSLDEPMEAGMISSRRASGDFRRLDLPAELHLTAQGALVVLWLVGKIDLGVRHGHALCDVPALRTRRRHRRDEDLLHRHFQEILLTFAGLAGGD